jgi:hypothetical protein
VTVRGALGIAAGWAQARLDPQFTYEIELEVFGATTAVRLEAFDDSSFAEELERVARRSGRAPRTGSGSPGTDGCGCSAG